MWAVERVERRVNAETRPILDGAPTHTHSCTNILQYICIIHTHTHTLTHMCTRRNLHRLARIRPDNCFYYNNNTVVAVVTTTFAGSRFTVSLTILLLYNDNNGIIFFVNIESVQLYKLNVDACTRCVRKIEKN